MGDLKMFCSVNIMRLNEHAEKNNSCVVFLSFKYVPEPYSNYNAFSRF